MINIRKTKLFLNEEVELLSAFDPRQILSVSVFGNEIEIFNLDRVYPLNKKMHIYLPKRKNTGGIQIRSIQRKLGYLIVEVNGPVTPQVAVVIGKISEAMKHMEIIDAFFPAHSSGDDSSIFFAGNNIGSLKCVMDDTKGIKNIRMVNEHILVFASNGRELKTIPVADIKSENWLANSLHVWTAPEPEEIVFIGRVKNLLAPITLKSGKVVSIDIFKGMEVKTEDGLLDNVTSGVGHVYKGIGAAITNDEVIIYPR